MLFLGDLSLLNDRDTTFVLVSRASLSKLEAYKTQMGWSIPWFSRLGSDFNYDLHVTNDEKVAPIEYNYRNRADMKGMRKDTTPRSAATGVLRAKSRNRFLQR
jgi:predicted dithiol-disulfide oxidoreductase (DUF899 family)